MHKVSKGIVAIAVVLVLSAFVYYRYTLKVLAPVRTEEMPVATTQKMVADKPKEVSTTMSYDVPEADITHTVKFTLRLDTDGRVVGVRMAEMPKDEPSDKQQEFADGLLVMVQGKKLSELTKVDRVGKSTVTTDAFNSVLDKLKSQL